MYLTGFTLFLSLILNRTYHLIGELVKNEDQLEVIKKQASLAVMPILFAYANHKVNFRPRANRPSTCELLERKKRWLTKSKSLKKKLLICQRRKEISRRSRSKPSSKASVWFIFQVYYIAPTALSLIILDVGYSRRIRSTCWSLQCFGKEEIQWRRWAQQRQVNLAAGSLLIYWFFVFVFFQSTLWGHWWWKSFKLC